jgi:hypothetical protein
VPAGSVHAGEYDGGPTAAQWGGIGLMATALTGAAGVVLRRRLGRAGV